MKKPAEIMKLENGKIAVRWQGTKKFVVINDDIIAQYLTLMILDGE